MKQPIAKADEATVEVRRERKGELRVFVDGRPVKGVKGTTMECVGLGRTNVMIRLSGEHIRLTDEEGMPA